MDENVIKRLKDNLDFQAYMKYCSALIEERNNVLDLLALDNMQAGESAKVRAQAITYIRDMLKPFMMQTVKKEPTIEQIQIKKAEYGL